jgi:hypothetical protein
MPRIVRRIANSEIMLQHALKEWAVICKALAEGRQSLLLRKGGIAEANGVFEVEQRRFWLFPTFVHQQKDGIQADALPLLDQAEAEKPPAGIIRLSHFAEVSGIYVVKDAWLPHMLAHLHIWSEETVSQRFAYRQPGLYVLSVRVYRSNEVFEVPDLAAYQGCRSWVELEKGLPDEGTPVLSEEGMRELRESLDLLLNPTAFA